MKQGQLTEIINESLKLNESVDTGMEYWYYTKHGIGPGAIPKGVTVLDTVETDDWGTYVLLDKMLTTKELEDYEIKEQVPSEDEMNKARNSANKSLTESFEIYFSDLNDEAKQQLLDYVGVEDASEMNWDIDMAPIAIFESTDKSLTEARNPENDEVNAIIRKWAKSGRNRLSKHDQEVLDDYGLSIDTSYSNVHMSRMSSIQGTGDMGPGAYKQDGIITMDSYSPFKKSLRRERILDLPQDFDIVNYLNTKGSEKDDTRFLRPYRNQKGRDLISSEEIDSLQPYSKDYRKVAQKVEKDKDAMKFIRKEIGQMENIDDDPYGIVRDDINRRKHHLGDVTDRLNINREKKNDLLSKAKHTHQVKSATKRINDMAKRDNG